MLGAHRPRKNLPLAVAAVSQLRERGMKLKLVVTGNIHPSFESMLASCREFVCCAGVLPKAAVFGLLQRAAGLVFPSLYEGFGLPMLEAMAAGCPVLSLDTPINREVAGEAAWFLPAEPRAWADALAQVFHTNSWREEMRQKGFNNLCRFSWDDTAAVYASVLAGLA
jgi:glycosyltransferase involved in cell wall biosynthesis